MALTNFVHLSPSGLAAEQFLPDPKLLSTDPDPSSLNPNSSTSTFLSLVSAELDPSIPPLPIPTILNSLLHQLPTPFLASLLARFQRNNHVLFSNDSTLQPFAHVVLAEVSRSVNHSCVPTAVVSHQLGREVGVRTISDVKEGEEVCLVFCSL
jgi:hypothetical protein